MNENKENIILNTVKIHNSYLYLLDIGPTRKKTVKDNIPTPVIRIPYFNTTSSLFHPNWSIEIGVPALKFQKEK